jgi:hypothetical protein
MKERRTALLSYLICLETETIQMRKPRYCLSTTTKGAGRTYPQHQEMLKPYDYDSVRSVHRLSMYEFAEFEPDFNTVVLAKSAKATDLISSAPIPNVGLLVSSRFLELLQSFKLPPHRVYPAPMVHKEHPLTGYFFVHLPQPASLMNAATTQDVEEGAEADPKLHGVSLLKLYRPSWMGYTWVDAKLKSRLSRKASQGSS